MKAAANELSADLVRAAPARDAHFEPAPRLPSVSSPTRARVSGAPGAPKNPPSALRDGLWARFRASDALVALSVLTLASIVFCALFPSAVAPSLPTDMHSDAILARPGLAHWFGTDQFGRDVFSLLVYGARQSVLIGVFAVLISCSFGVSIGLTAGYSGGWIDTVLMRFIDIWLSIPNILLAIALSTVLGPSLRNTILAISLTTIPRFARVLRGQAQAVRSRPFIEASRAAGVSHFTIIRRHVLPHCSAQILVLATLGVGTSILIGSSLSFLGLGVNDERPDWGFMLTQGRSYLTVAWWTVTYPGLAITALVVSVNLLGDALKRHFDPRRAPR